MVDGRDRQLTFILERFRTGVGNCFWVKVHQICLPLVRGHQTDVVRFKGTQNNNQRALGPLVENYGCLAGSWANKR